MRPLRRALLLLALAMLPCIAAAQDLVAVRTGRHPGFDRIVFEWSDTPWYGVENAGGSVVVRFTSAPGAAAGGIGGLRNLVAAGREGASVRLLLRPGVVLRHSRMDNRVVLDLMDGGRAPVRATPQFAAEPVVVADAATPGEARPVADTPPRRNAAKGRRAPRPKPSEEVAPPATELAAPKPATAPMSPVPLEDAVPADPPPVAEVKPAAPPPPPAPPAAPPAAPVLADRRLVLPVPAKTGAAVVRRGETVIMALEGDAPLDAAALRTDPDFAGGEIEVLPGASLLRLPVDPQLPLRLRRDARAWILEIGAPAAGSPPLRRDEPIELEADSAGAPRLFANALGPGRVVPVRDPETGMPLLLGTVRQAAQAVQVERRLPELDILRTVLGFAVLARSDAVSLESGQQRFTIGVAGNIRFTLDRQVAEPAPAPAMTRSFDFAAQPPARTLERLKSLQSGIAAAPPLERVPQRRAAAEALLALGMPQEAQAMLALGYAEDPRGARDPLYTALTAISALLAGRLGETQGLSAPGLAATDEVALWRAALAAAQGDAKAAAEGFRGSLPLLAAYPRPLQRRLLPLAADAFVEAGEGPALKRLIAGAPAELELGLPRAMALELDGKLDEALAAYDALLQGRDRLARAKAMRRAVELRLANNRLTPAEAAKALEASLIAWRGADEVPVRLRVAALRRDADEPRAALAILRETATLFPDQAAPLKLLMAEAFAASLEKETPLAAVALYDAYPELLPAGERGDALIEMLADRLVGLELTDRAAALLRPTLEKATGVRKAALGLKLAQLRLREGDLQEAQAALASSQVEGAPPPLKLERAMLAARIEARRGRVADAAKALRALGPPAAEQLAEVLTEAQDWPGAASALAEYRQAAFPAAPAPLDDAARRVTLREAALLAMAGDEKGLAALRDALAPRMGEGPLADGFALLTADPLRGLSDLPRLQRELQIFRRFPARLEPLRTSASMAR